MQELRKDGRTILFVSHNMQAVTRLCKRLIYLDAGVVVDDGEPSEVSSRYMGSSFKSSSQKRWNSLSEAPGNDIARLLSVSIRNESGETTETIDIRQSVAVEMEFEVLEPRHVLVPNYHFTNDEGAYAFAACDQDPEWRRRSRPLGRYVSTAWIPGNFLSEGALRVGVALSTMSPVHVHFFEENVLAFQVIDKGEGDSARGDYAGPMPGIVRPLLTWTTEFEPAKDAATQLVGDSAS
jgi:lipopolysaccharide transport system ATP-binding protein